MDKEELKNKKKRIYELTIILNEYRDSYYNNSKSVVSDYEYDCLYDELDRLEKETGFFYSGSPTMTVGYEVKSKLEKVKHNHPMLSLDKTKSLDEIIDFLDGRSGLAMLKMDGLTCSNMYKNYRLESSESRGNGEIGEDVLHNAKTITNLPQRIEVKDLIVDGEVIITTEDFEKINEKLPEDDKYKNCRNLASGSIRQLDSKIAANRHMKFIAWKCVSGIDSNSFTERLDTLAELGFDVVPYIYIPQYSDKNFIELAIKYLKETAIAKGYPIDGIVFSYDDIAYGESLGVTGHHVRSQMAYKFYDEEAETILKYIEWTMGKTGTLCPTACFESVEIDGTTVERASLHNISIMKELELSYGDTITVYKANQIIPQVKANLSKNHDNLCAPPVACPICGHYTEVVKNNDTEVLVCKNPDCKGKLLGKLVNSVSRNALNIDGLSEATLEKFIELGWISSIKDVYHLDKHAEKMSKLEGFGKKSVNKLLQSIKNSRQTNLARFLYAQNIPLVGNTASKDISKLCEGSFDTFIEMMKERPNNLLRIDGFGNTMYNSLMDWMLKHSEELIELAEEFAFEEPAIVVNNLKDLSGKTFCITGSLNHYANRHECKAEIEKCNGKVTGSVTSKTSYLVNNDVNSMTGKNKKAKELGIPIISEDQLIAMLR